MGKKPKIDLDARVESYRSSANDILNKEFFARRAEVVAREILGMTMVRVLPNKSIIRARIHEIAAYEGTTNKTADTISYPPGVLGISMHYGNNLIDIGTHKSDSPSCITLISGLFYTGKEPKLVQGPGRLSKELGITQEHDKIPIYDNQQFWIERNTQYGEEVKKREKSGLPENCLGFFYI
ncbi:MAG: DNA-3-methyladenine glycosylase [Nanoarchaeota archaeon]|nr:DNA-3-methyladenine glycosylase [Nanoarchaeota archaeon]